MWDRFSSIWTGFWIGVLAAYDWCFYHLVQPGDGATVKAFAYQLFFVHFLCLLLASLPELAKLTTKTARRVLNSRMK